MLLASGAAAAVRTVSDPRAGTLWRSDTVGVAVLMLVSFVGWVVVRYSETYLSGDPHQRSYIKGLLSTLTAVTIVVIANNLLLLTLAWMATSLALHGMLTFFGDRPVALAVAHKKFLLARCADVCMLGAVLAFGSTYDTLRLDRIVADAAAATTLPTSARIGIALIATAALLKCAQLPFHGWLIQVMEAPTPVSALLHAGVVNIGGFVLLRVAPVVDRAVETRTLLVIVGTTTAVISGAGHHRVDRHRYVGRRHRHRRRRSRVGAARLRPAALRPGLGHGRHRRSGAGAARALSSKSLPSAGNGGPGDRRRGGAGRLSGDARGVRSTGAPRRGTTARAADTRGHCIRASVRYAIALHGLAGSEGSPAALPVDLRRALSR
jgi:hypothetical protein